VPDPPDDARDLRFSKADVMDSTNMLFSLLAGLAGSGMLMYAKSSHRIVPMGAGLGLLIFPYFVDNLIVLTVLCVALIGVPFVIRDA
jgi:hypothetical protein